MGRSLRFLSVSSNTIRSPTLTVGGLNPALNWIRCPDGLGLAAGGASAVAGAGTGVGATVVGVGRPPGGAAGPVPAAPLHPGNDAKPPSRIRPPTRAATLPGTRPTGRLDSGPCCTATPVAPGKP